MPAAMLSGAPPLPGGHSCRDLSDQRPMKIKFITTGGTIDKVYFDALSEYAVGSPQVLEVLKDANVTFEHEVESVLRKDSLEMTEEDRALIRKAIEDDPCPRIIVTHGTDTMILTARALQAG